MRPERDCTAHFFSDDDMAQYSISSLLGDTIDIDSIKKAEFRQRTDSSAAKIKEIVSEIREDITVMEKRRSRETTPTAPIPADVRPDPAKQREQILRNLELVRQYSPAQKYKELLERQKKEKKTIVRRKFSLVHALPDKPKKDTQSFASSAPSSYSMSRLLASSPQMSHYDPSTTPLYHHSTTPPLQYTCIVPTSLPYPMPTPVLQYSPSPVGTPAASPYSPMPHHHQMH
ncbi:hypothetical protein PENTCL1PPCAC_266 [Pristionchus entomophagus]|uniref:Uncharacterized protein n=1 Tax=Pristionchus entomophagus TaxID=358040 RepID=A0AAV5S624_9BILA|nr:hypothetical protein PENTCL1PPCAC_266 [Pristionchus entomophagus]